MPKPAKGMQEPLENSIQSAQASTGMQNETSTWFWGPLIELAGIDAAGGFPGRATY